MTPQLWIGVQLLLDILMVGLLVWVLRSFARQRASWNRHEAAIQKAEAILVEMREISRTLETNLQEKKELSHRILTQMDQELKRAEESYTRISALQPKSQSEPPSRPESVDKTRASVGALLERGLSKEEIATHLGISVGEVDLIVKLFPQRRGASEKRPPDKTRARAEGNDRKR
jgi:hypothetical protein